MNPTELLQRFAELLRRPPVTWWDVLDILIVSILIYELLKLIRGTRAVQMAVGIASIVGLFYLSRGLQLETLNWLIRNIIGYVVFAAIVLLQADIRRRIGWRLAPAWRFLARRSCFHGPRNWRRKISPKL